VCSQLSLATAEANPASPPAASSPPPAASSSALASAPATPREPYIPIPARYSGELGGCEGFLHQCSLVFDQQLNTYGSDRSKIAFIKSPFSDRASLWAVAASRSRAPFLQSYALFSAELLKIFDFSVQGREVSKRLLSLRQGRKSVADYSIDFRIAAAESGWDETALRGVFQRSLADNIQDELAAQDDTDSLEELISLAIRLDNRLREIRREKATSVAPAAPQPRRPVPACHHDPSPRPPVSLEEPMQLGRMRLTPEERQRRFQDGLCLYCGRTGHAVSRCPQRPKEQAHRTM
uniref:CCHC-type domain-containing protein n=1 Tax=Sparus aurata TaxID=8175 RepID=A0A671UQR8_SPAAU